MIEELIIAGIILSFYIFVFTLALILDRMNKGKRE